MRPHALAQITGTVNGITDPTYTYDANGNMTAGAGRTTTWTSFNMPGTITRGSQNDTFWYNTEHERTKELHADGTNMVTLSPRYDIGLHFVKKTRSDGVITYEHFLYAGSIQFAQLELYATTEEPTTFTDTKVRYFHKDALNSIVAITDETGTVLERLSYDPYGKRRSPNGEADPNGLLTSQITEHGYTSHEHLDNVGLIHMNGRVYDPLTGQFLSADFMVPDAGDMQSYNRYSYAVNNPLVYIDADGQCPWCIVAIVGAVTARAVGVIDTQTARAIIGIAVGAWIAPVGLINTMATGGLVGGISSGQNGILGGALSAGLFYGAGSFADTTMGGKGAWAHGGIGRAAAHAVAGCVGASATGGDCGSGALSAGFAEFAGPKLKFESFGANLVAHAVIGGTASVLGGGKFENGAMTGAFGYLFNCEGHPETCPGGRKKSSLIDTRGEENILLQALLPAHTAAFSRNPILGSTDQQVKYANTVNMIRLEAVTNAVYLGSRGIDTIITLGIKAAEKLDAKSSQMLPVTDK